MKLFTLCIFIVPILYLPVGTNARFVRCNLSKPRNCEEVQAAGFSKTGIYQIYPDDVTETWVFCDLETDGGGWTVFQRRVDTERRNDEFYQPWNYYASGFGFYGESFWLGLDLTAQLTESGDKMLRVELMDWENESRVALYENFQIANSSLLYKLSVSGYSGDAGDSLSIHNATPFSTYDNDNDVLRDGNCAIIFKGAWWYRACHSSNLNGLYLRGEHKSYANGVNWLDWRGHYYSLKRTEMKFRSKNFQCFKETLANFC